MKLLEKLKNIKTRELFLIVVGVWLLDIITTIYALNFSNNYLVEGNPITRYFLSFGFFGYLDWIIVGLLILFSSCLFVVWAKNYILKRKSNLAYLPPLMAILVFCLLEIIIIINNLILIIR